MASDCHIITNINTFNNMRKLYSMVAPALLLGAHAPMMAQTMANANPLQEEPAQKQALIQRSPLKVEIPDDYVFPDPETLIMKTPEGEVKEYAREAYYWVCTATGYMYFDYKGNTPAEMVEGEDGSVYIKNPYTDFVSNSYLKGTRDGNKIKVTLPQAIYREPNMTNPGTYNTYYACIMMEEYAGSDYYNLIDRKELTYTIDGDKITLDLDYEPRTDPWGGYEYPYYILGMVTDEGIWMSEGEAAQTWTPFSGNKVEVPADVTFDDWAMTHKDGGMFVQVGFDGNDIYMKGLLPELQNSAFKGTIDGDKIVFESGQFLGIYNSDSYAYMVGISYDADNNAKMAQELTFTYDKENKIIKGDENTAVAYNRSKENLSVIKLWRSPEFKVQPADIDQTPLAPSFIEWQAFSDEAGQGFFRFNLPINNKDGYILNERNMYYNVYFDGALETFYTDEYTRLEEDLTDVPYTFKDGWNFYALGTVHVLYYYSRGVTTVGVVLCNKAGDTVYSSPMTILNMETGEITSGISNVADGFEVESEEWFSLDGKRISSPANGIYIRKAIMSDGSVKVDKIAVRK